MSHVYLLHVIFISIWRINLSHCVDGVYSSILTFAFVCACFRTLEHIVLVHYRETQEVGFIVAYHLLLKVCFEVGSCLEKYDICWLCICMWCIIACGYCLNIACGFPLGELSRKCLQISSNWFIYIKNIWTKFSLSFFVLNLFCTEFVSSFSPYSKERTSTILFMMSRKALSYKEMLLLTSHLLLLCLGLWHIVELFLWHKREGNLVKLSFVNMLSTKNNLFLLLLPVCKLVVNRSLFWAVVDLWYSCRVLQWHPWIQILVQSLTSLLLGFYQKNLILELLAHCMLARKNF